jgi:hypothetical protein
MTPVRSTVNKQRPLTIDKANIFEMFAREGL